MLARKELVVQGKDAADCGNGIIPFSMGKPGCPHPSSATGTHNRIEGVIKNLSRVQAEKMSGHWEPGVFELQKLI